MIGSIINTAAIVSGGVGGAILGNRLPKNLKEKMPSVFGCCALGLGICLIIKVTFLPVPILALLLGTIAGELMGIENGLEYISDKLRQRMDKWVKPNGDLSKDVFMERYISLMVIFCVSGTGIFGALNEGMTGDASLLIAKAFLDFFTAGIFAATLGITVAFLAIPQFIIQIILFFSATQIMPLTTPEIIGDFSAAGGLLLLAMGLRLCGLGSFPLANMLPSLLIVMPLSAIWILFFSI